MLTLFVTEKNGQPLLAHSLSKHCSIDALFSPCFLIIPQLSPGGINSISASRSDILVPILKRGMEDGAIAAPSSSPTVIVYVLGAVSREKTTTHIQQRWERLTDWDDTRAFFLSYCWMEEEEEEEE